jgi:hypothetical protein
LKPEIGIDDIPAPGEPLEPAIHEENQRLIDEEMAERIQRAQARLDKKTLKKLKRRYEALGTALVKAKWNALVTRHYQIEQALIRLRYEVADKAGREWWGHMSQIVRGIKLSKSIAEKIAKIQPLADEFESIKQRFKAHEEVLQWEREDEENRRAFQREALVWQEQIKAVFRQSKRLHHLWDDSDGHTHIDIPEIERILFKDDRVIYQIKTMQQNIFQRFFGNRWSSALPYNVDIQDLTSDVTLANLSAGCKRVVTVLNSEAGNNLFYSISRLDAANGIPKKQLYSRIIDFYPIKDHAKTPWPMGTGENRTVEWATFEEYPHLLLAGSTKGGKSNHLNAMIACMCTMNTPSELAVLLIDLKGGIEFIHWEGLKHQIRPMVKSASEVLEALRFMRSLMVHRLSMFKSLKAKSLEAYNQKARDKLPRLVIIVDEMATTMNLGKLTTDIHNELNVISSQGRAVGLHMVMCTQHSSVDIIPGWVKTNMGIRASTSMPTDVASQVILGTGSAAKIPKIPGRIVFSMGRDEVIVQSPYISDVEIARAVEISQSFPDANVSEFETEAKELIKPVEMFGKDDLYAIVLEKLGGKISAERVFKELGGKENDVITLRQLRSMVKEINEIGVKQGIVYQGTHYKLKKVSGPGNYSMVPSQRASEPKGDDDTEEFLTLGALARSDIDATDSGAEA